MLEKPGWIERESVAQEALEVVGELVRAVKRAGELPAAATTGGARSAPSRSRAPDRAADEEEVYPQETRRLHRGLVNLFLLLCGTVVLWLAAKGCR